MIELEGAEAGRATATGMAAVTTAVLAPLKAGDHVVAARRCSDRAATSWKICCRATHCVHSSSMASISTRGARRCAEHKKLFSRKPRPNPTLDVLDISAIAEIAHRGGARLIVDNVFATPIWQSPLTLARCRGVLRDQAYRRPGPLPRASFSPRKRSLPNTSTLFCVKTGPSMSPFNAWILLKGLEDVGDPRPRTDETAAAVADALAQHPKISRLIFIPAAPIIRRPHW